MAVASKQDKPPKRDHAADQSRSLTGSHPGIISPDRFADRNADLS